MLIKSYLQYRYQKVKVRNGPNDKSESDWGLVKQGVPQGSILGPLLFLVYINDLPIFIKYMNANANPQTVLFADDTSVIVSNPNNTVLDSNLKSVVNSVAKWFKANLLSLNVDKTYCMKFSLKHANNFETQVTYNNKIIPYTTELKFLGLVLHNNMSWKSHIENLAVKLTKACYGARVIRPFVSLNSLKMIYHAYFHSVMSYGLIFWGTSSHSSIIFKLQKRMVRILMKARPRDSCRKYFNTYSPLLSL